MLITLSEYAPTPAKSLEILRGLYAAHGQSDIQIQGKLLNALVDSGNLAEAVKIQQKLPLPQFELENEDEDIVSRLIEDGMPERRKEKKTKDIKKKKQLGKKKKLSKDEKKLLRL